MERRGFLRTLIGGVAAAAAVRTFPFRVYSFPLEPVVADANFFVDDLFTQYLKMSLAFYNSDPYMNCQIINMELPKIEEKRILLA